MPDMRPSVTVVIPCYNQARYLDASVASVRRQSYPSVRILVVDDGSTDRTAETAAGLGAGVVRQTNAGLSAARNAGLAHVTDEFVIFLDADDTLLEDAVERGVDALTRQPFAGCAVGRCIGVDDQGRGIPSEPSAIDPDDLYGTWLAQNFVWTIAAAIFRTVALRAAGGFPRDLGPAADYAVYLTLARRRQVVDHGAVVAQYRQHDDSMSRDAALMLRTTLAVLRRERRLMPRHYATQYVRGMRKWRDWYGEQMVETLRQAWHGGSLNPYHLSTLLTLATRCPRTVSRHARRKAHLLLRSGKSTAAAHRQGA